MKSLEFVEGNTLEGIKFTVKDRSNSSLPFDLTSAAILFIVASNDKDTFIFSKSCDIVGDPTDGICLYQPTAGNMDTIGRHVGELKITKGGNVGRYNRLQVVIEKQLPTS